MATALKRVALLLCVLLMVLALTPASPEEHQGSASEAINNTTRLSTPISSCELCQQTGQCDEAFQSAPGQFCQTLVLATPCCCSANSQCVLDNADECRCKQLAGLSSSPNVRTGDSLTGYPVVDLIAGILAITLGLTCGLCSERIKEHFFQCIREKYLRPEHALTQCGTSDPYPLNEVPTATAGAHSP